MFVFVYLRDNRMFESLSHYTGFEKFTGIYLNMNVNKLNNLKSYISVEQLILMGYSD